MCWLGSVWLPGTAELINSGTNNKDMKLNNEKDGHSRAGPSVPHSQEHWVGISKSLLGFLFCSQDGSADPGTPSFITSPQGRTREKPRPGEGLHTPLFPLSWRIYLLIRYQYISPYISLARTGSIFSSLAAREAGKGRHCWVASQHLLLTEMK